MELKKGEVIAAIKKSVGFSQEPGINYQVTAYSLMELLKGSTIEDIRKVFRDWQGTKIVESPQDPMFEIPVANSED